MINRWHQFCASFHGSETIVWARVQYLFVALLMAINSVDLSAFITDRHLLLAYMLTNAFFTEIFRKRREDWDH